jgi:hypothetical protein
MLTTPHLLVGAAIGSQLGNPYVVVPAAVASHFVLDSVPHLMGIVEVHDLDKKDLAFVASDVIFGVSLVYIFSLLSPNPELIYLGAFSSMIPDFHHTFQALFGPNRLKKYTHLHMKFHYKKKMGLLPGMATQILTVIFAVGLMWFRF